ncbi:MAG: WecB/TagA/CpsF family glycosyltransferase [Myxococcales bacterium]|nr:WecB/TagA/CpsF family glycosyltransferase [Myxococcales bacterium]
MQGRQFPRDPTAAPGESGPGPPQPPPKPEFKAEPGPLSVASRRILGLRVDATSYAETTEAIVGLAAAGAGGMVCHANVHMAMEAFDDAGLRRRLNAAERITPDGVPLVWALRWLGLREAGRVYGPTLTRRVCRRAAEAGIPVGFYGGRPEVLEALAVALARRFPRLRIAFAYSPPFRPLTPEEDRRATEAIEASGARILFVGLGCPKQERWMASHRPALRCVLLGVGAAFDFLAGAKPQAPRWLQRAGLEWLFRLVIEPRRLWRRYLVQNPRFVWHFARQIWSARRSASADRCR